MIFDKDRLKDHSIALCWGLQAVLLLSVALRLLALPSGAHDGIVFFAFIGLTVIFSALLLRRDDLTTGYLGLEAMVTLLMLSAAYKATIYDNSPVLANRCMAGLVICAALLKVFPKEIMAAALKAVSGVDRLNTLGIPVALGAIIAMVYMPDLKAVLAEIFIGEQAHHLDFFVMAPGVACLHGGLPYVDVISQYGVGIPWLFAKLSPLLGGFDYLPILRAIVLFGVMYFIIFFLFARAWLNSGVLAFAAFLVVFRLQMFHYGTSPLCWIYPSSTPARFGLDIFFFWMLYLYAKGGRKGWLYAAAVYAGVAVFYMTASGLCVLLSFYCYLAGEALLEFQEKRVVKISRVQLIAAVLPLCAALLCFLTALGRHALDISFWRNAVEYMKFFANGHGALPFYESLKYRHYWAFVMALALPLTLLATALSLGAVLWFKKADRVFLVTVVIAVNGLLNYQYFVVRSAITSYYQNAVPFVLVCAFWVHQLTKRLDAPKRRQVHWACVLLAFYALATNHNYISYPNIFNFSRNPLVDNLVAQHFPDRQGYFNHQVKHIKEEDKVAFNAAGDGQEHNLTEDDFKAHQELKDFVAKEYDFSKDAAMIARLTSPQERVPIVSSFETKLLIDANRAPFFYHTPLVTSLPMRTRYFPSDAGHSPYFVRDTIAQLEKEQPPLVFIENIYLQENYPASYNDSHYDILQIVRYVREHYVPSRRGQYLTAMSFKP